MSPPSEKYDVAQDSYCYEGTRVLKNLLDLQDQTELDFAEMRATGHRIAQISPGFCQYNLAGLQKIHACLFQDIYSWAGHLRTVDISKGRTRFANVLQIEREADKLFKALAAESFLQGLPEPQFITRLAHYYCELNVLHPFRDGNGRAQRILFELLAIDAGFVMRWQALSADEWVRANEAGYFCNLAPLRALLQQTIHPIGRYQNLLTRGKGRAKTPSS